MVEVGDESPILDANGNIDLKAYQVKDGQKVEMLRLAPHGYEKVTLASENATIYFAKNLHDWNANLEWNKKEDVKAHFYILLITMYTTTMLSYLLLNAILSILYPFKV